MKVFVKKFSVLLIAIALIVASALPMVAFEVKRYYGDVNNDGFVTIEDARSVLLYAIDINGTPLGKQDLNAVDFDGDGKIGIMDARKTLRISAQLEARSYMPTYEFDKCEEDVLALVNNYRKTSSEGSQTPLNDLEISEELSTIADVAAMEFVTQTGTAFRRQNGTYFNTLLDDFGVSYKMVDKVMCVSTTSYAQAFEKMLSQKQGDKALRSANFKKMGIGAYSKDGHTVYWCIILTD